MAVMNSTARRSSSNEMAARRGGATGTLSAVILRRYRDATERSVHATEQQQRSVVDENREPIICAMTAPHTSSGGPAWKTVPNTFEADVDRLVASLDESIGEAGHGAADREWHVTSIAGASMWAPMAAAVSSPHVTSRPADAMTGGGCPRDAAVKWLRSGDRRGEDRGHLVRLEVGELAIHSIQCLGRARRLDRVRPQGAAEASHDDGGSEHPCRPRRPRPRRSRRRGV